VWPAACSHSGRERHNPRRAVPVHREQTGTLTTRSRRRARGRRGG
jgi:hypothetical protein